MRQSRCTAIGLGNVVQESGTDNASGTPQQGDGGKIQFPAILLTGSAHQSKPLRITYQTGGIQGTLQSGHRILIIIYRMILHMHIMLGHQHTQVLLRRQITGKNSFGNHVQRRIELQRVNDTPTTRSFLPGSIQNVVEQITASLFFMTQNG